MSMLLRPMSRRSIWSIAGAILILMVVIEIAFVDVMPQSAYTDIAITVVARKVAAYYRHNKRLPANLDVLPKMAESVERTTDAWHRRLHYRVDADDRFTLISFGRDGVPGGTGDDADVAVRFHIASGQAERVR